MNNRSLIILILLSSFLKLGCVTYRAPEVISKPLPIPSYVFPRPLGLYHQVEYGQTLWAISRNYGVSVSELMKYNTINRPQELTKGARIFIPAENKSLPILPLYISKPINWRYIIIHHSATDVGSAAAFDKGHKRKGWKGLGYHFVIDNGTGGTADGDIEASQRWFYQTEGAHCDSKGMNRQAIGICLVGNFDKETPSQKQLNSLIALVDDLIYLYKIPLSNIKMHKDISGEATDCPGENFPWHKFKQDLSRLKFSY